MMKLEDKIILALDIETNGIPPFDIRPVEVEFVRCTFGEDAPASSFDYRGIGVGGRVRLPKHLHMSKGAAAVNGIGDKDAHENGWERFEFYGKLCAAFDKEEYEELIIVGHNILSFDIPILIHAAAHESFELAERLRKHFKRARIFDTKVIWSTYLRDVVFETHDFEAGINSVPCKLEALHGSDNVTAHGAAADAVSSFKAFVEMYRAGIVNLVCGE